MCIAMTMTRQLTGTTIGSVALLQLQAQLHWVSHRGHSNQLKVRETAEIGFCDLPSQCFRDRAQHHD